MKKGPLVNCCIFILIPNYMGIITNHDIRIPFLTNQAFYDEKYDPENGHYVVGLQFHPAARLEVFSRLCRKRTTPKNQCKVDGKHRKVPSF